METDTGEQLQEPVMATGDAPGQMRAAREKAGLSLADVASRTRVPLRHLEALERGDYGALPGITYCAGFARAFARAVNMDEVALVSQIRREIEEQGEFASAQYQIEEPVDPARIPPRTLAWVAAVIALVIVGGYGLWRMQLNAPPSEEVIVARAPQPPAKAPPAVQPPVSAAPQPVVLTATDDLWLRIYDRDNKALLEGMMKRGDSFAVPANANSPMILTGRADALAVTVGGRPVPPLGTAEKTIVDFPISAQALLARGAPSSAAAPAASVAPGPAATRQPQPLATGTAARGTAATAGAPQGQVAAPPAAPPSATPSEPAATSATPAPAPQPQ